MLITCPECSLPVSDKALACPHCGYPLKPEAAKPRKPRTNKRKRLPNGFGQITELKGKALRKPFRAMVTVGKTPEGKPICKLLKPQAYFQTYNEAYSALMEYNKNPFDLMNEMTVEELYNKWAPAYYEKLVSSSAYQSAWKYCTSIYGIPVRELKIRHIKYCLTEGSYADAKGIHTPTPVVRRSIKMLLSLMYDYAIEHELVEKNVARSFRDSASVEIQKGHMRFTEEEMSSLIAHYNEVPGGEFIIIQCYTGMRPQELGNILLENVHLDERYFIGGMKTDSGKNRIIPIHHKIYDLIRHQYQEAVEMQSKYLFNIPNDALLSKKHHSTITRLTYKRYATIFSNAVERLRLNPNHTPHDCRVQFVTMAKKASMDEYAIKRVVGHKINDVTESVYTRRDPEWLLSEIEKIA